MKDLPYRYDPVTNESYVLDQEPSIPLLPFKAYKRLPDYTPPAFWREWNPVDAAWDSHYQKVDRAYHENVQRHEPDHPVPMWLMTHHFPNSYARKNGLRGLGETGVVFWCNFPRIDPCWLVITYAESYKMVTEAQFGVKH